MTSCKIKKCLLYIALNLHNNRKILILQKIMTTIDAMDEKVLDKVREYLSTQPILKAWVFGSFSRGEQTPTSDVDIIVVFDEKAEVSLIGYIRIQYELENIFGRKVDLVEDGSLLPFAVESANRDKKLIYERAS
ncbi:MAG: nucleotidyltransferase family protein [Bacteroidales bacterium]|nr:nucleotidyltransferase family protein [Bacteroidales bacterium]